MTAQAKILAFVFGLLPAVACGASLTEADRAQLAADGVKIGVCEERARTCKDTAGDAAANTCWAVFDSCLAEKGVPSKDGGKREGGKR